MKIGFDVSQTGSHKAGCGYVADSLVQALAAIDDRNEYLLYPTFGDGYWDPWGPETTRHIDRPNFRRARYQTSRPAAQSFWCHPPGDLDAEIGRPDVVHSHNFFCPSQLRRARLVYTAHDLSFLVHPEFTPEDNREICFEGVFKAAQYADLVLAVSEATRRHFLQVFPHYPEQRTGVMYLASRFTSAPPAGRPRSLPRLADNGFLLCVGTVEPRKNPWRLVRAYARYAASAAVPLPLALVGGDGWLTEGLGAEIADLGIARHVVRLGYVDDAALQWLYGNCRAFVYPSLFEGFGLPVVEAMSQGAAVITSNVTSLPEVAGDAALLVDPTDELAIRRAIEALASDTELRDRLRAAAPRQAARFSWRTTAEQVLEWYGRVVEMERYVEERSS